MNNYPHEKGASIGTVEQFRRLCATPSRFAELDLLLNSGADVTICRHVN